MYFGALLEEKYKQVSFTVKHVFIIGIIVYVFLKCISLYVCSYL